MHVRSLFGLHMHGATFGIGSAMTRSSLRTYDRLHKYAMSLPKAVEEQPWGHPAIKVRNKTFLFMSARDAVRDGISLSVKLPVSHQMALTLPFTEPTGYGLGKSGWVTARFPVHDDVPVDLLQEWILQSYCAIAPKKLLTVLDHRG